METHPLPVDQPFHSAQEKFLEVISTLQGPKALDLEHGDLEKLIETEGRELMRRLLEESYELRGLGHVGLGCEGRDGVSRTHKRVRTVQQATRFGKVAVERLVYSLPGYDGLAPKEAQLNLADNSYSHGLQEDIAFEASKGSFEDAITTVERSTGVKVPKRQTEQIAASVAKDFEEFYKNRQPPKLKKTAEANDILALSCDAKGIVVRKQDLREATKKKADKEKLFRRRLGKGEKKNSKRMAQVATVYSTDRHDRTAEQIVYGGQDKSSAPKAQNKRVWASLEQSAEQVIEQMFEQAERRDPHGKQEWVALVDGNRHQLEEINKQVSKRDLSVTIILDVIHVIEYLWKAARNFFDADDKEAEQWVSYYLEMILMGDAKQAAAGMRRSATRQGLKSRQAIDTCAGYLHNNVDYLQYDDYLERGLPIATGVIEGACRHLVKDRMDLTGARWSLGGAEAILRLRAIRVSGDWEEYWKFHVAKSYERNHQSRYKYSQKSRKANLKLIK